MPISLDTCSVVAITHMEEHYNSAPKTARRPRFLPSARSDMALTALTKGINCGSILIRSG